MKRSTALSTMAAALGLMAFMPSDKFWKTKAKYVPAPRFKGEGYYKERNAAPLPVRSIPRVAGMMAHAQGRI